jgi:hypothetical protein
MGKFIEKLDELYLFHRNILDEDDREEYYKHEFLGGVIFNFTTYDGEMDELLSSMMVPVIECILRKKTFEYQEKYYIYYIMMVNMPFLADKLDWGTSIRGAWFDDSKGYEIDCGRIIIDKGELTEFMEDIVEWGNYSKNKQ